MTREKIEKLNELVFVWSLVTLPQDDNDENGNGDQEEEYEDHVDYMGAIMPNKNGKWQL
jgi:hypothetical protein